MKLAQTRALMSSVTSVKGCSLCSLSVVQLWALLHFIMPTLFDSHAEFDEWFSKDIESSVEKKSSVDQRTSSNSFEGLFLHCWIWVWLLLLHLLCNFLSGRMVVSIVQMLLIPRRIHRRVTGVVPSSFQ